MTKKYKVILLSGGFDTVHKGHIECINIAKELEKYLNIAE